MRDSPDYHHLLCEFLGLVTDETSLEKSIEEAYKALWIMTRNAGLDPEKCDITDLTCEVTRLANPPSGRGAYP